MKKPLLLTILAVLFALTINAQCFNVPCFSHISVMGTVTRNYSGNRCFTAFADVEFNDPGTFNSWTFLSFYAWQGNITINRTVDMSGTANKVYVLTDLGKNVTMSSVLMGGNDTIFVANDLDITTLTATGVNNVIMLNTPTNPVYVNGVAYNNGDTIYTGVGSTNPVFVLTCAPPPTPSPTKTTYELYDIQGRRVETQTNLKGVYIKRYTNGKVEKIVK